MLVLDTNSAPLTNVTVKPADQRNWMALPSQATDGSGVTTFNNLDGERRRNIFDARHRRVLSRRDQLQQSIHDLQRGGGETGNRDATFGLGQRIAQQPVVVVSMRLATSSQNSTASVTVAVPVPVICHNQRASTASMAARRFPTLR